MADKSAELKVLEYGESLEYEGVQWSELCFDDEHAFEKMKADFLRNFSGRKKATPYPKGNGYTNNYNEIKNSTSSSDWFGIDSIFIDERTIK